MPREHLLSGNGNKAYQIAYIKCGEPADNSYEIHGHRGGLISFDTNGKPYIADESPRAGTVNLTVAFEGEKNSIPDAKRDFERVLRRNAIVFETDAVSTHTIDEKSGRYMYSFTFRNIMKGQLHELRDACAEINALDRQVTSPGR